MPTYSCSTRRGTTGRAWVRFDDVVLQPKGALSQFWEMLDQPPTPTIRFQRLATVCSRRYPSPKGTYIADQHWQMIFEVIPANPTKPEVKATVEAIFKVEVDSVQMANVSSKKKRFGQYHGRRHSWKRPTSA